MHGWNATDVDHDGLGVRCMNELITKEMLEGGYVPDVIFDKLEEYKSAVEWFASRLLSPWGFSRQEYQRGLPSPPPGESSQLRD